MLVEFSVENYLSFRDMVTLSLEASQDKESPDNIIESAQGTDLRLLKSAAVYGPNASGKSNLMEALRFMRNFILTSAKAMDKDSPIGVTPFKLDEACRSAPSTFEAAFLEGGVQYLYGFAVDSSQVHGEWLYSYPMRRKRVLFERDVAQAEGGDPANSYRFGGYWEGEGKRLARITRSNALFISVAAQFKNKLAELVVDWFYKRMRVAEALPTGQSEEGYTLEMSSDDPKKKSIVLQLLKNADYSIVDFDVHSRPLKQSTRFKVFPPEVAEQLLQRLPTEATVLEATTTRQGLNKEGVEEPVSFESYEESDGTQKYFALAGPLVYVLSKGCCLVIDELDVRLHPLLTRSIIELFHNTEVNKKGAQLIFATHDVNLMEAKGLFRRDQIWLTEKDEKGATSLYSLWDYRSRKDENLRKGYLAGRYGGVPFVENLPQALDQLNE